MVDAAFGGGLALKASKTLLNSSRQRLRGPVLLASSPRMTAASTPSFEDCQQMAFEKGDPVSAAGGVLVELPSTADVSGGIGEEAKWNGGSLAGHDSAQGYFQPCTNACLDSSASWAGERDLPPEAEQFEITWADLRMPGMTVETAGWARQNFRASMGSVGIWGEELAEGFNAAGGLFAAIGGEPFVCQSVDRF